MTSMPASNDDHQPQRRSSNERILAWLSRLTNPDTASERMDGNPGPYAQPQMGGNTAGDWPMVTNLCGYKAEDFADAGMGLPLSAAEVEYFQRNHRSTESQVSRDFLTARVDLPSPLAELYGLYLHRARVDAEAALFVAQATGSTRVARIMADLLAIGSFANSMEFISYLGLTYSVPAAFDTSNVIDRANFEASRRMALATDHPSHLLKLTPDEIGVLATNLADGHVLSPTDFLDKANLLAEARQDVNRLPANQHFATAIVERDLPMQHGWVTRICSAYMRLLENWVVTLPEAEAVLH